MPFPTARRSLTARSRGSPTSTLICLMPCAALQRMPRTTGSSSSSTVAGAPRRTRNSSSVKPCRSTARKRRPPAGWRPPPRPLTCRGRRSTSGTPMPPRGCPGTAPSTGCARSTATNRGTTSCAPTPPSRLSCQVRRPYARSQDAAVTSLRRKAAVPRIAWYALVEGGEVEVLAVVQPGVRRRRAHEPRPRPASGSPTSTRRAFSPMWERHP